MIHSDSCLQKHLTVLLHLCLAQSATLHFIIILPLFARPPTIRSARLNKAGNRETEGEKRERARERDNSGLKQFLYPNVSGTENKDHNQETRLGENLV